MTTNLLRIATRQSPLALWQANHVRTRLLTLHPELSVELVALTTDGDKDQSRALSDVGGKSLFVKTLQQCLLDNKADIAVHCIKDMSVQPHADLSIGAILKRGNPADAFVSNHYDSLDALPEKAIVGTASPRRQSLLLASGENLNIKLLRGNVNTRLQKLDDGQYDAILLAAAGLERLGFESRIKTTLDITQFIPAIGQGALGIEYLKENTEIQAIIGALNDDHTARCVAAEQAVNQTLGGSCFSPIGAHATIQKDTLHLNAFVGALDGKQIVRTTQSGALDNPHAIGIDAANALIDQDALSLIKK